MEECKPPKYGSREEPPEYGSGEESKSEDDPPKYGEIGCVEYKCQVHQCIDDACKELAQFCHQCKVNKRKAKAKAKKKARKARDKARKISEEKSQNPPNCHILYKVTLKDCNGCFLGCNTDEEMRANHTSNAIVEFDKMMGIFTELNKSMYTPENKNKIDELMNNIALELKMIVYDTLSLEQGQPDE
jgi:hypothetical protein